MATQSLSSLLAKAKKNWSETVETAKKNNSVVFDDGSYTGQFVAFDIKQSNPQEKGKVPTWGCLISLLILEGDKEGKTYYQWVNLFDKIDGEEQLGVISPYFIPYLEKFTNTDAEELDISKLEEILKDCVDENQVWDFTLKTGSAGFQNLRLIKRDENYKPAKKGAKSTPVPTPQDHKKPTPTKAEAAKSTPKKKTKRECPFEEGQEVTFTDNDIEYTGTVAEIDLDNETVDISYTFTKKVGKKTVEEEAVATVGYDNVTAIESDLLPFEEGDEVIWIKVTGSGKRATTETIECTVESVDTENETCNVVFGKGKNKIVGVVKWEDLSKPESEEDEEEDEETTEEEEEETEAINLELEEGDEVTFTNDEDLEVTGTVVSLDEDEQTLEVKIKVGKKFQTVTVPYSSVVIPDAEEEDEEGNEEDEEEVVPTVGDDVEFIDEKTGKEVQGKIVKLDPTNSIASVKVGTVVKKLSYDDIQILR